MKQKASTLVKTTSVYMIGSMLSKVLNLLILPYISLELSSAQYGVYDLIQTIVGVALPIFTMQAIDAAFRFVYLEEQRKEKGRIISNVWFLILLGSIIFSLGAYGCNIVFLHLEYIKLLILYYIFNVFINMFQRIARCYDDNKVYAISGVIQTFVLLVMQVIFLHFFDMKENGLVYAYCISCVISCVYIEWNIGSIKDCSFRYVAKEILKKIIKFSAPLIPNSISWWAVSSVNRIIIVAALGYSANGIFSMANKFASIITMIGSTFVLAWQEYVLTNKDNVDKDKIFSQVFEVFFFILACCTAGGTLLQQIFFKTLIGVEYAESFFYIPIIMLTAAVSTLNSFWGVGYFAYEKTGGAFKTTIIGAIVNLILSFVLIRDFKLYGIAFACLLAYLVMWIMRYISMAEYFYIRIRIKEIIVPVIMVIASYYIYYLNQNLISMLATVMVCLIFVVKYRKILINILKTKKLSF